MLLSLSLKHIVIIISSISILITACGEMPLTQASTFKPNSAPGVPDCTMINEGIEIVDPSQVIPEPGMVIEIECITNDPDATESTFEYRSDYGSFSNQNDILFTTKVTFIVGNDLTANQTVTIIVTATDQKGATNNALLTIGTSSNGPIVEITNLGSDKTLSLGNTECKQVSFVSNSNGFFQVVLVPDINSQGSISETNTFFMIKKNETKSFYICGPNHTGGLYMEGIPKLGPSTASPDKIEIIVQDSMGLTGKDSVICTVLTSAPEPGASGAVSLVNATSTAMTVQWLKATDLETVQSALSYKVYQSDSNNIGSYSDAETSRLAGLASIVIDWTQDITSVNVTSLEQNKQYYFNVFVKDTNGDISAYNMNSQITNGDIPSLTTITISAINNNSAQSGGTIVNNGGLPILQKGLCYSINPNPSTDDITDTTCTNDGDGLNNYTSSLTGLTQNTTYYVRAYATNIMGTGYGNHISFVTQGIPSVVTSGYTYTDGETQATVNGQVTNNGSLTTTHGVCYDTNPNPDLDGTCQADGTSLDPFSVIISGLTIGQSYYVRAYATNTYGTVYGSEYLFTVACVVPSVVTTSISAILPFSATGGGNVTSNGGCSVTARGICWSTSVNPDLGDTCINNGSGIGVFTSTLSSLSPNTNYYVRAYATNSKGPQYGNQVSFTTAYTLPTVTTSNISSTNHTTATGGGTVTNDGGGNVSARGVCWNTTGLPSLGGNCSSDGTGAGGFSSTLTGLTHSITYYVRAYATNPAGTAYGDQIGFMITYNLRDIGPGGGRIFYDKGSTLGGWRYLEAAPHNYQINTWGCQGTTMVTPGQIGEGLTATQYIVSNCGESPIAAKYAYDTYSNNGFSDWFLPSIYELIEMFNQLCVFGVGDFLSAPYWSSTQDDGYVYPGSPDPADSATVYYFVNPGNYWETFLKNSPPATTYVKPVRMF